MRPNAIVIPQLAVQQGPKGHFVYVIRADELAEIRPVIVGDYQGDKDIVILSGLGAGDRVVVDGVLKVVPGQPVKAIDAKLASGAPAVLAPAALGAAGAGTSSTGAGEATAGTARGSARSPASIIPTEPPSGVPSSGNRSAENGALTETTRNAAALAGKAAASEPASRSASAQKAAVPRAPQAPAPPGPPIAAGSYGPVRDGETLIEISMRARPEGVSLDQTLVGIFRANPEAFDPDHHRLKSGATLAIPAQADLAAIDPRAAADEVRRAREKWAAEHRGK
jgi:FimV-like protein